MKATKIILTIVGVIVALGGIVAAFKFTKLGKLVEDYLFLHSYEPEEE